MAGTVAAGTSPGFYLKFFLFRVTDPDPPLWPAPLLRFVDLFNRGEFWESHEVLEAPWRQGRSGFYKALILLASGYVHAQRGNPRGIVAQMRKAEREFSPFRPRYLGFDVDALIACTQHARKTVQEQTNHSETDWEVQVRAPALRPNPALVRGDEPELRQSPDSDIER